MTEPARHLRMQWGEFHRIEADLATLDRLGVLTTDPAYQRLWRERGAAFAKVGTRVPRSTILLAESFGFSPGTIKLRHDGDIGFFAEARVTPKAHPIYHRVTGEEAVAIIKEEIPPELHDRLFTPDPYIGE